ETLNTINDRCWAGAFTWWAEQNLMVYRYGLMLAGDQVAGPDQIDTMIGAAVAACGQYYPAIQLVTWAERTPQEAVQVAIGGAYGRA
ncbi:YbjN domain-containing protein, partial [Yoonia sp.]|uniref:YbjN domain-containing protein n=1 Tax=Yoonia sp. TaxID=2212373 RepID=UPI002E025216|nr:YbjN domain-containing protein [Yoonia sp.]